jgi:hypothetical protein
VFKPSIRIGHFDTVVIVEGDIASGAWVSERLSLRRYDQLAKNCYDNQNRQAKS